MIWYTSQCPSKWKEAILIPIIKQGKNPQEPQSYRPIALTSTFCKIMERMINNRLNWYLEKYKLLSNHQCGFRKGRSTKDHIIHMESSVNKGFANKESTLAVFLDLEKAYDMLWPTAIIIKLQTMGICGRITQWIHHFLSNRKIQVKINNTFSNLCNIKNGISQGSVISPTLFNIAVNDLAEVTYGINISQYADDIAIWKSNRNTNFLMRKIQQNLNDINKWCKK